MLSPPAHQGINGTTWLPSLTIRTSAFIDRPGGFPSRGSYLVETWHSDRDCFTFHEIRSTLSVRCIRRLPALRPIVRLAGEIRTRLAVDIGRHIERLVIGHRPTPSARHIGFDKRRRHADPGHARCNIVGSRSPHWRTGHRSLPVGPVAKRAFLREDVLTPRRIRLPAWIDPRNSAPGHLAATRHVLREPLDIRDYGL